MTDKARSSPIGASDGEVAVGPMAAGVVPDGAGAANAGQAGVGPADTAVAADGAGAGPPEATRERAKRSTPDRGGQR